jgi:hypothetical protein
VLTSCQYSGKDIEHLESDIDSLVLDLQQLIKREYPGKVMDFARLAQYFTFDVLSKVAFGSAFGYLEANEDLYDYNKTSAEFLPILEMITKHPSIRSILTSRIVHALAAPKGTDKIGQGRILGICSESGSGTVRPRSQSQTRHARLLRLPWLDTARSRVGVSPANNRRLGLNIDSRASHFHVHCCQPCSLLQAPRRDRGAVSHPVIKHTEALQLPYLSSLYMGRFTDMPTTVRPPEQNGATSGRDREWHPLPRRY